jgi:hypothetical protein
LFVNQLRGWDATGVAGVREVGTAKNKENQILTYKKALHFVDFIETKGAKRFMEKFNDFYYVIGHVRASTIGRDDDMNAHPFQYGPITLCHNGTVDRGILTVKTDESVDSAHIASYMAEHGEKAALEKLDGGFSLVWHNAKDDTLNFARNTRKPMAMSFIKSKNELYYGSEYFFLWATLRKLDQEIDGPVFVTRPMIHYKFHKEDLRKYEMQGFKEYVRPQYPANNYNNWGRGPVVHQPQNQTDTSGNADAGGVVSSNKSTTSPSTGTVRSLTNRSTSPTPDRVGQVNRVLEVKGQKVGLPLILKPMTWQQYNNDQASGKLELKSFNEGDKDRYVVYGVKREFWVGLHTAGRVAIRIRNVASLADDPLCIICDLDAEYQALVNKNAAVMDKLEAHGFGPEKKEDSKSDKEGKDTENHVIPGPKGRMLSMREFLEYAKRHCSWCDSDIDTAFPSAVGWTPSGDIICGGCKNDPAVHAEITGYLGSIH